jgi:hypothetical protein
MSRQFIKILMTAAALGCFVAGATFARSNIADSAGGQAYMTKVDFDRAIADATEMPRRDSVAAMMTMVDLDRAIAHATAMPRQQYMPAIITMVDFYQASAIATETPRRIVAMVDFDHAFANTAAVPRRENTPPNREKLRDAGWQRILGSR